MSQPTPLSVRVAARVRGLAAEQGVTQMQVAEHLGLAQTAVSKRFRGVTPWPLDELERMAELLGVDLPDLIGYALAAAS